MSNDFERRVRRKIEEISRSQEMENIKRDIKNIAEDVKQEFSSYHDNDYEKRDPYANPESQSKYRAGKKERSYRDYGTSYHRDAQSNLPAQKNCKTVSVSGILMTVFGGVGLGVSALFSMITALGMAVAGAVEFGAFAATSGVFAVLALASGGVLGTGISKLKRTSRLKKYLKIVGRSQFCPIDMLVQGIGRDKAFVLKDLQKMIQKKALPNAHIDDEKTCLMLTDEVYNQYRYVQQQAKQRQEEQQRQQQQQQEQQRRQEEAFASNPELASTIRQGREMIQQIRQANDRIAGEEISAKMFRLEKVAGQIFEQVEEHPEKLPDIRRLMNYYLPTTLKLLTAYEDFENQPIQGENIRTGKAQIEKTLDTINLAFENLLDQLFADDVLDVSSDISVLETMLKQEGLTGSEFKTKD